MADAAGGVFGVVGGAAVVWGLWGVSQGIGGAATHWPLSGLVVWRGGARCVAPWGLEEVGVEFGAVFGADFEEFDGEDVVFDGVDDAVVVDGDAVEVVVLAEELGAAGAGVGGQRFDGGAQALAVVAGQGVDLALDGFGDLKPVHVRPRAQGWGLVWW